MTFSFDEIGKKKPDYTKLIIADDFFDTLEDGYLCPKCNKKIIIDDEDHVKILKFLVRGMSNLANIHPDRCPHCKIFIAINLITDPVSVEGFVDHVKWKDRMNLFYEVYDIPFKM